MHRRTGRRTHIDAAAEIFAALQMMAHLHLAFSARQVTTEPFGPSPMANEVGKTAMAGATAQFARLLKEQYDIHLSETPLYEAQFAKSLSEPLTMTLILAELVKVETKRAQINAALQGHFYQGEAIHAP